MTRTLSTAEDRREALLEAALPLFAARGIHGTPTLAVAKAERDLQAYSSASSRRRPTWRSR
jgi:DNA-binding transcriptional regulator YbjK